ncbi:unnamed protein product [Protopolystoma xenopodis]|uniref:Uncharacterized protein n=1 Tax=Protopolystoma xenopodis TaxID=117903 RepID=A0A3S5CD95_9PLAT|nr:unnamed protein product [Protopolystoma xenopodis]
MLPKSLPTVLCFRFTRTSVPLQNKDVLGGRLLHFLDVTHLVAHRLRLSPYNTSRAASPHSIPPGRQATQTPVARLLSISADLPFNPAFADGGSPTGTLHLPRVWLLGLRPGRIRLQLDPITVDAGRLETSPIKQVRDGDKEGGSISDSGGISEAFNKRPRNVAVGSFTSVSSGHPLARPALANTASTVGKSGNGTMKPSRRLNRLFSLCIRMAGPVTDAGSEGRRSTRLGQPRAHRPLAVGPAIFPIGLIAQLVTGEIIFIRQPELC